MRVRTQRRELAVPFLFFSFACFLHSCRVSLAKGLFHVCSRWPGKRVTDMTDMTLRSNTVIHRLLLVLVTLAMADSFTVFLATNFSAVMAIRPSQNPDMTIMTCAGATIQKIQEPLPAPL